jgi:hypothetical protein
LKNIKDSIVANNHSTIKDAQIDKRSNEYKIIIRKTFIKGFVSGVLPQLLLV